MFGEVRRHHWWWWDLWEESRVAPPRSPARSLAAAAAATIVHKEFSHLLCEQLPACQAFPFIGVVTGATCKGQRAEPQVWVQHWLFTANTGHLVPTGVNVFSKNQLIWDIPKLFVSESLYKGKHSMLSQNCPSFCLIISLESCIKNGLFTVMLTIGGGGPPLWPDRKHL